MKTLVTISQAPHAVFSEALIAKMSAKLEYVSIAENPCPDKFSKWHTLRSTQKDVTRARIHDRCETFSAHTVCRDSETGKAVIQLRQAYDIETAVGILALASDAEFVQSFEFYGKVDQVNCARTPVGNVVSVNNITVFTHENEFWRKHPSTQGAEQLRSALRGALTPKTVNGVDGIHWRDPR